MEKRFCGFCKCERNFYSKSHVAWTDVVSSAALAAVLMLVIWQGFDPRVSIFFALFLGLAEFFILVRWRLTISCPYCGFDPVLYRRSPAKAALKVTTHLDRRRADPNYLLSSKPYSNLPRRKAPTPASSVPTVRMAGTPEKASTSEPPSKRRLSTQV
jgi:hypothetical protein